MRRRLLLLNIALTGALGLEWTQYKRIRAEYEQRSARNLNQPIRPERAPALPALAAPQPVVIANYADVAVKTLFSRDRNSTVIPDPPAPPPPQKPMPPLPSAYGAMYMGEPRVILGFGKTGQRSYRKGDTVGDFKVLDFDRKSIAFEWEGKRIDKRMDEVMAKPADTAPPPTTQQAAAPAPVTTVTSTTVSGSAASGPGTDVGGGFRACVQGDTSPNGTVKDGYKKVSASTPFGPSCRWESVK